MKKIIRFALALLAVTTFSAGASAQEPGTEKPQEISIGYKVEVGTSSTHVVRGASQGATKTTPSTEELALLRFDGIGPGKLSTGASFAMPFAGLRSQPQFAMEMVPFAAYCTVLGPVETTVGFAVKFFPNASVVDGQYEALTRVALPNKVLTPFVEVLPELVRRRGAYAAAGVDHVFAAGAFSVRPRLSIGAQGFAQSHESFHANEATAIVVARASLGSGFYTQLSPAYSVLVGPDRFVKDTSWSGRSVAYAALGFGVER